MSARRYLLTGCSGAGKSALLAEMARRGHETVKEPGRRVIRAEERMGGKGTPWENEERFCRLCLKMATADFEGIRVGTALFDRGVFDAAVHFERLGHGEDALRYFVDYRFDALILAPPWAALYQNDPDRRHSFDEAVAEYDALAKAAKRLGYEAKLLPEASVEDRADWLEILIAG